MSKEPPKAEKNEITKEAAKSLAEPVVKKVVDLLAARQYKEIGRVAELPVLSVEDMEEIVEEYLKINELPYMDGFGVPCSFQPSYEYHQLSCIPYNNGSGFHMDYDLTTDSEVEADIRNPLRCLLITGGACTPPDPSKSPYPHLAFGVLEVGDFLDSVK